jgi:hypothetical protein
MAGAFPRNSEAGLALLKEGRLTIQVRQTLLRCDWASAASWAPLASLLESDLAIELQACAAVKDGQQEFGDKRRQTERKVEAELKVGKALVATDCADCTARTARTDCSHRLH